MRDIAQRMGVSTVTVSKALGGKEGVSDKVREEIIAVATEMGYKKNLVAKDMRDGTTHNIGILISERHSKSGYSSMKIQQELSKQLLDNSYYAIFEVIEPEYEESGKPPRLILENKVDGIIILGQLRPSYVNIILSSRLPAIFVDFSQDQYPVDTIICDNVYGGYVLTNHLLSLGHRRIAFIGNPMYSTAVMDRYLGYYKALMEQGVEFDPALVIHDTNEFGHEVEMNLPTADETAYVCLTCQRAYQIMKDLQQNGLKIPEKISVVAFDEDHFATLSNPPLTTFSVDVSVMAATAAQTILSRVKHLNASFARKTISGKLTIRQSSTRNTPAGWDTLRRFG